jgi:hypothetical protein
MTIADMTSVPASRRAPLRRDPHHSVCSRGKREEQPGVDPAGRGRSIVGGAGGCAGGKPAHEAGKARLRHRYDIRVMVRDMCTYYRPVSFKLRSTIASARRLLRGAQ